VDPETFARVRAKLHASFRRRTPPLAGGGEWALSGLLFCAHCQSVLWGVTNRQRRKGKVHVYRKYLCSGCHRPGLDVCRGTAVRHDEMLDDLVAYLQERLAAPGALEELREEIARMKAATVEDVGAQRSRLLDALGALTRKVTQGNANLALLPPDRLPGVI